jgi:hypothetical protein
MRASFVLPLLLAPCIVSADWPHYGGGPDQTRYSPLTLSKG